MMRKLKLTTTMASLAAVGLLLVGCGTSSASGGNATQQNSGADQSSTPTQTQSSTLPSQNNGSSSSTSSTAPSSSSSTSSSGSSNSSSGQSGSNQGTSSQPAPAPSQNQPGQWITVTSPQAGTSIKPGMTITMAGKVAEQAFWNKTLHVTLFSGTADTKQTNHIVHEQDFTISGDGTFQGTFQVPNSPFPANSGSSFEMVLQADYPHAPTYSLTLTPQQ